VFRRLVQDVVRAFDRGVERLLDHEVFAGPDGRKRGLQVQRRWRGDTHRVQPGLREQRVHIVRSVRHAVLGGERFRGSARAAHHTHQAPTTCGRDGTRMKMRDGAGADETEA
jgi:hypothetical protein